MSQIFLTSAVRRDFIYWKEYISHSQRSGSTRITGMYPVSQDPDQYSAVPRQVVQALSSQTPWVNYALYNKSPLTRKSHWDHTIGPWQRFLLWFSKVRHNPAVTICWEEFLAGDTLQTPVKHQPPNKKEQPHSLRLNPSGVMGSHWPGHRCWCCLLPSCLQEAVAWEGETFMDWIHKSEIVIFHG